MKKRLLTVLLSLTIIAVLAACGNNANNAKVNNAVPADTSNSGSTETVSFPTKNIEIIVPFSAGGVSDILTRSFVEAASEVSDATFTVKNVNGGSGTVGNYELVRANPDGHTWLWAATGHVSSALHITPAEYTMDDFTIVNKIGDMVAAVVVPKDSQFNTLNDLLDYAKANPGDVTVGNPGDATVVAMLANLLEDRTGVTFQHVPYQGSGELLPSILGAHVEVAFMNVPEVKAQIEAGQLKALAVLSEERMAALPDVPTAVEQGIEGVSGGAAHFFIIPNNVDPAVVAQIDELTKKVYESEKFKALMDQNVYQLGYKSAEESRAEITDWYNITGEIYKKLGKIE